VNDALRVRMFEGKARLNGPGDGLVCGNLKETGDLVVLTINGKAELVVQDAAAYQKLRQLAEEARVLDGIRQGIADMNAGRTVSLDEFKKHARTKHGIKA
jgi:PHD/YefM family antitoxin component YafN of YafNO toxin-antitoxin module